MQKEYKLWYAAPAPNRGPIPMPKWPPRWSRTKDEDWEMWSLPLGCGYFGANIFGRTDTERIQITEVSLANPYPAGVNNFAEVYLDIGHDESKISSYMRDLVLNNATAHVEYDYENVKYSREYFASYPNAVAAVKLTASKNGCISFVLRAETPHLVPFGKDIFGEENPQGKTGEVTVSGGNTLTVLGEMEYYGIKYEGQIHVTTAGGKISAQGDSIKIEAADSAVVYIAAGTNYVLDEKVYLNDRLEKLSGNPHPHGRISGIIKKAAELGYDKLKDTHVTDYSEFFNRVSFDIGGQLSKTVPTDKLLENYKNGVHDPYLEELYFQYGRYLLIASSRKGALPGNLQGIWNSYGASPWSAGYWHNINIQMNYWPAFTTNLAEMFVSYADMNKAFYKLAQKNADEYVSQIRNENPEAEYVIPMGEPGQNGWAVGTGGWPYDMSRPAPGGHSGPGTSALTAKLFWDYYDYTRDMDILKNVAYPILSGVANFLSKSLIKKDGLLLAHPSASPEQRHAGAKQGDPHIQTTGCAFDQQMTYENHKDTIAAAEVLGIDDETVRIAKEQLDKLEPIQIGTSGQIKEYREENAYGDLGDPHHRHISHLKALHPGQLITSDTPKWVEAAKVTLDKRGDKSTGWAMAHRLLCWARVHDGSRAYTLYQTLLKVGTLPNLWDTHPPFQIDGNYGGTAGVSEMLLQSNGNTIEPLPALPPEWKNGSFCGLVARGNFVAGCTWQDSKLTEMTITARAGGECIIRYPGITAAAVCDSSGNKIETRRQGDDMAVYINKGSYVTIGGF